MDPLGGTLVCEMPGSAEERELRFATLAAMAA